MKFTIRLSIASLFIALFLFVSLIIIGISYHTMHRMVISSSRDSIQKTTNIIVSEINGYVNVFKEDAKISSALLRRDMISFNRPEILRRYLVDLVSNRLEVSGAYLSNAQGSLYFVEKDPANNQLHLKIVDRSRKPFFQIDAIVNRQGHITSSKKTFNPTYDPRQRLWYIDAVNRGSFGWSTIYQFKLTPRGEIIYGVTASDPIYDANGKLQAIFSVDTTINLMADFLSGLKKTPHTFIYIMDNRKNTISSRTPQLSTHDNNICSRAVCHISEIKIPWVKKSLDIFTTKNKSLFEFQINNEDYLANYHHITNLFGGKSIVGIVLPLSDIIGPLENSILICIIVTIFALFIGLVLVNILASKIAKPVAHLAKHARAIAQMNIAHDTKLKSYIKEVIDMRDAFNAMKQALRSFARYVPFEIVKQLIRSGEIAKVGGKSRDVSLLFSDIQSFTALSELMKPCDLMEYLSEYFNVMSTVIHATEGTIDKYIGDGIMAFWNAPSHDRSHAEHVCQCALMMIKKLKVLNSKWKEENKPILNIRIGINTANVVVGNVGSVDRLSYTALGDGVNLASRLEALNKLYHTSILVAGATYELVKDRFSFRLIDHARVRGKRHGGPVYELLDEKTNIFGDQLDQYNKQFEAAFHLYRKGQWPEATNKFKQLQKTYPKDKLIDLYLERIQFLKERKPKSWSGVWEVDYK